ncbi:hypothetical protein Tco_1551648, partial [Tanacetum coccineum]
MVEKSVVNNKGKITGPMETRLVWDNTVAVVLTKSGQVPVNAAKQSSYRAAVSVSAARRVNIAAPRPNVNDSLPTTYSYFKTHSPIKRPFNQKSAAKTNNFNEKANTARIWRPTGNVIDHISKDSGSYTHKRFDYVDPQGRLNGCSRHMTRNNSFLTDYQEIDGGFVAFGRKLKFNLFSVSQMCDKKNSVLFTKSECLILSPSFNLLDESQVVLRASRKDSVYSLDLKNIVPSR